MIGSRAAKEKLLVYDEHHVPWPRLILLPSISLKIWRAKVTLSLWIITSLMLRPFLSVVAIARFNRKKRPTDLKKLSMPRSQAKGQMVGNVNDLYGWTKLQHWRWPSAVCIGLVKDQMTQVPCPSVITHYWAMLILWPEAKICQLQTNF